MRIAIRFIVIIGLVLFSIYIIHDQWKKLKENKDDPEYIRDPRGYDLEELQNRRERILKKIENR